MIFVLRHFMRRPKSASTSPLAAEPRYREGAIGVSCSRPPAMIPALDKRSERWAGRVCRASGLRSRARYWTMKGACKDTDVNDWGTTTQYYHTRGTEMRRRTVVA